jgi:hypothetical protein
MAKFCMPCYSIRESSKAQANKKSTLIYISEKPAMAFKACHEEIEGDCPNVSDS